MSNRTAEASKAIHEAWEREKTLVLKGQGTRDWTPEQQKDIIGKGKAYDEDGKAFEGHHMKSAEKYPEFQGDADNIQFLTRTEHRDAHGGDFHNSTNGYYDYNSKKTTDFGDNKYTPCKPILLENPQYNTITRESIGLTNSINKSLPGSTNIYKTNYTKEDQFNYSQHLKKQKNKGLINIIKNVSEAHPIITELVKTGAKIGVEIVKNKVSNDYTNKPTNKPSNNTLERNNSQSNNDNSGKDYPENRSSPVKHEVSGYDRKNGTHVKGYKRGGKK